MRSPEVIVDTPGVLAFLAGALFRAGINSLELMSVYTDSTFVVREEDVLHAFRVLSELVHPSGRRAGKPPGPAPPRPRGIYRGVVSLADGADPILGPRKV